MSITEEKLVDRYGQSDPHERFMMIYKNYEVFLKMIESYEIGLFNRILYEREYNLRAKKGEDIGIRIRTNRVSDPTARQAIENILIREAIEEANDSGNILKDTDDPQKHKRDILTLQMMRREYEVFDTNLKSLPGNEFRITYRYLHDGCKLVQIAEDEDKAYQTILNIVSKTRKKLKERQSFSSGRRFKEDKIMGYKRNNLYIIAKAA